MNYTKNFLSLLAAGFLLFAIFSVSSCNFDDAKNSPIDLPENSKKNEEIEQKNNAQSAVRNIVLVADCEKVIFSWKNPDFADYGGVQITTDSEDGDNAESVIVPKERNNAIIEGLSESTEYKFVFIVLDKYGNGTDSIKSFTFTTPEKDVVETIKEVDVVKEVEVIKEMEVEVEVVKEVEVTRMTEKDTTPPGCIALLKAISGNERVKLSWKNPLDSDFLGVVVSAVPAEGSLKNPIVVAKNVSVLDIFGLTNGKSYEFSFNSIDESLNFSEKKVVVKAIVKGKNDSGASESSDGDNAGDSENGNGENSSSSNGGEAANGNNGNTDSSNAGDGANSTVNESSASNGDNGNNENGSGGNSQTSGNGGNTTPNENGGNNNGENPHTPQIPSQNQKYSTGDIIYSDGTSSSAAEYNASKKAVAVVFIDSTGNALGLGIKKGGTKAWAAKETLGTTEDFTKIQSTATLYGKDLSDGAEITGDLDGSDNWSEVCSQDSGGTSTIDLKKKNYPVFHWAESYGETAKLSGTVFEDGWYVPSISELYDIYKNIDAISEALGVCGGDDFNLKKMQVWSSSQNPKTAENVWYLDFVKKQIKSGAKTSATHHIRVVRKLVG